MYPKVYTEGVVVSYKRSRDFSRRRVDNYGSLHDITREPHHQIPTYTMERYPDFCNPVYRTELYKHRDLTPGQERRF